MHYGFLIASYGVMQLVFAPLWGTLSDSWGRKPVLLAGLTGLGLALVLLTFSTKLWMLYAAQILSGSLSSATLPAAQAYVGDSTERDERSGAMGKIGGAVGFGIVFGPGFGGQLAAPFLVGAAFCALTVLIVGCFLPESLPNANRRTEKKIPHISVPTIGRILNGPLRFGMGIAFMAIFSQTIFSSTFGLYALARFQYGPEQVGTVLMAMGLMYALSQGLFVGPLTERLGEARVILLALLGSAAGYVLILLAAGKPQLLAIVSIFILFNSLLKPSALAFVSRNTDGSHGHDGIFDEHGSDRWPSVGRIHL